jgi:NAD(P)-dependent dehydrogenase (short-subunit alcohol dehydrogenase family)
MDLELRGKNVLITGGSKGIGFACAEGFAAEGCTLHIAARTASALEEARDKLVHKFGVAVHCHPCDLGVTANAVALARACGTIDILVNNAGAIPPGGIAQIDDETWRRAWDLKVFGFINLTREVYAGMRTRRAGVIVNVIGFAAELNRAAYIVGSSGNASLVAFTHALGAESVDHGVRVTGVNPGRIQTERQLRSLRETAERRFGDRERWPEVLAEVAADFPFRRFGQPAEVADLVVYLASARASYISSTVVTIDAGQSYRPGNY